MITVLSNLNLVSMSLSHYIKVTMGGECTPETPRDTVQGKIAFRVAGASEAVAYLNGYQQCYVSDEAEPAVHITGGLREMRLSAGSFVVVVSELAVGQCDLDPSLKATCFQPLTPESAYRAFNLNLVV